MGIEISITNSNISGNVMNEAKLANHLNDNISLRIADTEISENAEVLNNLEINSVLHELEQKIESMDKNSTEYSKVKSILAVQQWDKHNFLTCIKKHLGEFSQGVLASIVANLLTP